MTEQNDDQRKADRRKQTNQDYEGDDRRKGDRRTQTPPSPNPEA